MRNKDIKILLVDDDDLNRRMMGLLFSENGYEYDIATNGIEAVTSIQSNSFDIVLMDLQMPLMDGFEATRKIREWETNRRHTPIVALTAMLFDDEMQRCLSVGMDGCIVKPFDTKTLFQVIKSYVNGSKNVASADELQKPDHKGSRTVLNIKDALPRFKGDIKIYQEFLIEFINDLPDTIYQFRNSFTSSDFIALADNAHNLKGVSSSLGAKHLSYLAQLLDMASRDSDFSLIQQTLEEIEDHILVLRDEANIILSGLKGDQYA